MLLERLFENLALTVEPFALCVVSRDWRLRMERLEWVTLHYVLSGQGHLTVAAGAARPLAPYNLALIPQRRTHAIRGGERASHEMVAGDRSPGDSGMLRFVAGREEAGQLNVACGRLRAIYGGGLGLFDLMDDAVVLDFSDSDEMKGTFERMLEESRNPSPGSRAMLSALMNECLVMVFRRLCGSPECQLPWLDALDDSRMAGVVNAVLEHPEKSHSLDSLAGIAMMSRSAFAEQFAASFGRTPMSFVRDVRLRRAAELLRTSTLPVDAVASRVGHSSRSHFSYAFRDYFGQSPKEFRAARRDTGWSDVAG